MEFYCYKVRKLRIASPGNDEDGNPIIMAMWDALFHPVLSQHETRGGMSDIKLSFWRVCPFEEGKLYKIDIEGIPPCS